MAVFVFHARSAGFKGPWPFSFDCVVSYSWTDMFKQKLVRFFRGFFFPSIAWLESYFTCDFGFPRGALLFRLFGPVCRGSMFVYIRGPGASQGVTRFVFTWPPARHLAAYCVRKRGSPQRVLLFRLFGRFVVVPCLYIYVEGEICLDNFLIVGGFELVGAYVVGRVNGQ